MQQTADVYNMQAVTNLTGVKAVTLRAWERRYGMPQPARSEGGQRLYSQQDIELINWLVSQRNAGMSISNAVAKWQERQARVHTIQQEARDTADQYQRLRSEWIDACITFDERRAKIALDSAFARWSPELVVTEILQKGMVHIGQQWHEGKITVQQEHFATALTLRYLERLIAAAPPPVRPQRIVVCCAPHDTHSFSPLLTTYLLRQQGYDVVYLGADVPQAELAATLDAIRPKLLIATAQRLRSASHLPAIAELAAEKNIAFGYGGGIFSAQPELRKNIGGYFLGRSLNGLADRVYTLVTNPPAALERETPSEAQQRALTEYRQQLGLIESDVWRAMANSDFPKQKLDNVNGEIARSLSAMLRLGNLDLVTPSVEAVDHLLVAYRLPTAALRSYLRSYIKAVRSHLEELPLRAWFEKLAGNVGNAD